MSELFVLQVRRTVTMIGIGLLSFVGPCLLTFACLHALLRMESRLLVGDRPTERGLHQQITPRGGGIVIVFVGVLCGVALKMFYPASTLNLGWPIGLAVVGVAGIGFWDDHFGLSIRLRLMAGLGLASVVGLASLSDVQWNLFGNTYEWPIELVILPAVVGLVWLMNLFNFMDGADGVAGVQGLIGTATLAAWFAASNEMPLALLNIGVAGACLGFLGLNWAPARVFLGDSGSLTLGLWFGSMSLIGVTRIGVSLEAFLILLGVFVFDATFTLVRRVIHGERITQPHREHLYQRLILSGWTHQQVAALTVSITLVMAGIGSAVFRVPQYGLWFFLLALVILLTYTILVMRISAVGTPTEKP
ncbi:MAG: glycosyltransferase family 4 protein [Proteobacteria bacterium]|nr:glycosyltransferase family 4 protein [Pseudomonadota bacterium]